MDMKFEFEILLEEHRRAVERFVYYKTPSKTDGDDVIQEVYISAFKNFDSLQDKSKFKAWILKIAANKCNDFYRNRVIVSEIPVNITTRYGRSVKSVVRETLGMLSDNDKRILHMYYILEMPQADIARKLDIPVGTVKSRLFKAKQNFKEKYPYPPHGSISKGEITMTKLPDILPMYTITKSESEPFAVKCEELSGWMIIPRIGEKVEWAIYDYPHRKRAEKYDVEVIGKAEVHGIEGVEILTKETLCRDDHSREGEMTDGTERTFIAQLTDTHSRFLSECHYENGVKKLSTFLDGDDFGWGEGEDNWGKEINLTGDDGRYTVEINDKSYDTILYRDIEQYNEGVMSEAYIDKNGRTVLWRRFNIDHWRIDIYKQKWSERLPDNEKIEIDGKMYVHWYDCITDYIL